MQPHDMVTIEVQEQELLDSHDFAHFLYLFRVAYIRCLDLPVSHQSEDAFSESIRSNFFNRRVDPRQIANLFNTDAEDEELKIAKVSKSSPLTITFTCVISALTAAVILSGGTVDLKMMKFKVPPLGVGIKNLREAFLLPPTKTRKRKKKKTKN